MFTEHLLVLADIYWTFLKIGFTSFGGLSMIPLINSEMLGHGWMTVEEVGDIVAMAEMTPGPLGINCATFAGMRVEGLPGSLIAVLGVLTPTLTICLAAAIAFEKFYKSRLLKDVLVGIRPMVLGMIFSVILIQAVGNYLPEGQFQPVSLGIGAVGLFLLGKKKWSVPKTIIVGAALGLLLVR